jgi:hypothetical protein
VRLHLLCTASFVIVSLNRRSTIATGVAKGYRPDFPGNGSANRLVGRNESSLQRSQNATVAVGALADIICQSIMATTCSVSSTRRSLLCCMTHAKNRPFVNAFLCKFFGDEAQGPRDADCLLPEPLDGSLDARSGLAQVFGRHHRM